MHTPAGTLRGQLQPRERVDGDGVRGDAANVAEDLYRRILGQEAADSIAETCQIGTVDRAVHGELDGLCHHVLDGAERECSSRAMSFGGGGGLLTR